MIMEMGRSIRSPSIILSMQELSQQVQALVGLRLSSVQLAALERYERELLEWNQRVNLTAIDTPEKIRSKHFLDSFSCLLAIRGTPANRVVDIGTGAGFPGLALKIACPAMRVTLVESVGKKADFCRHIVNLLEMEGVEILVERAETVGGLPEHRGAYDWALARAVAGMPILMEYLLPLVKIKGRALAMKGESGPAEAHASEYAIQMLGGELRQLLPVTLPGVEDQRYLVVVDKVAATPDKYPRRIGIPAKRPLQKEAG